MSLTNQSLGGVFKTLSRSCLCHFLFRFILNPSDYYKFIGKCILVVIVIFSSEKSHSQTVKPGGVGSFSNWYFSGDSSDFIANHATLNLLDLQENSKFKFPKFNGSSTLFLVVKPNFTQPKGERFFSLGDIELYDDRMVHGKDSTSLSFAPGVPKILMLKTQRSHRFKNDSLVEFKFEDSTLFSLAELIYFPKLKSRYEIRAVSSYLALKYGIPIARNPKWYWADYWSEDSTRYWDYAVDYYFNKRIYAIGKSQSEHFYQSQTRSSSGEYIQFSLDTIEPLGVNQQIGLSENSFLIFAEKDKDSTVQIAANDSINPLENWQVRLFNWSSPSDSLFVQLLSPSNPIKDSIFITNGSNYHYVPLFKTKGDTIIYLIDLSKLVNGDRYVFNTKERTPIYNVKVDNDLNKLMVSTDRGLNFESNRLEVLNHSSGVVLEGVLNNELEFLLDPGKYSVYVLGENNFPVYHQLVEIKDFGENIEQKIDNLPDHSINDFSMKVYPIPAVEGQRITLEIVTTSFTKSSYSVLNSLGQEVDKGKLKSEINLIHFTAQLPGVYMVRLFQGEKMYTKKFIVGTK